MIKKTNPIICFEFELFQPYSHYLRHCCFTRQGGVSQAPYDSLNVSYSAGDNIDHVYENKARIARYFSVASDKLFDVEQVHGNAIEKAISTKTSHKKADILLSNTVSNVLMIKHADCQAALFYDPVHQAIAAAHAGWRGLVQNVYTKTIQAMSQEFNSHPKDVLVGISPSLGLLHSEFRSWKEEFPEPLWKFCSHNHHMDLRAIAHEELISAGILPKHIEIAPQCTFEEPDLFFSYRREQITGRCASCIQIYSSTKKTSCAT